jgi:hypothetical protein
MAPSKGFYEIILRVFSLPILEASPAMVQGLAGRSL